MTHKMHNNFVMYKFSNQKYMSFNIKACSFVTFYTLSSTLSQTYLKLSGYWLRATLSVSRACW